MRTLRRTLSKVVPVLECLDTRVVPASMTPGIEQSLSTLGIPFQQVSPRLVPGPLSSGTQWQTSTFGSHSSGPVVSPPGAANFGVNVPRARSSTGTGTSGMTPDVRFNPALAHALGRQPVVVGLRGPGMFTSNLAIQFRQGSAELIQPFNAVPGAGATFGIAFL